MAACLKAVLPVLVQRFREQQSSGCLIALRLLGWICSLHPEALRCVSSHKRHNCYLPKGQCVCCCHFPFCWQIRSRNWSFHSVVSRSFPQEHMENIDIKEEQLRAFAKSACSYKITPPFLKPYKLCLSNFYLLRMLFFRKKKLSAENHCGFLH